MLVYGDRSREEDPRRVLSRIGRGVARIGAAAPGLARHAALTALLVDAGELAQALCDRGFEEAGLDDDSPLSRAAMGLVLDRARAVWASAASGFAEVPPASPLPLRRLARLELPESVAVKVPEGFAHYGLYPETYGAAARAAGLAGPVRVVGIRSIGTSLAAMVAAAAGATAPPSTVRPVGHPFARRLAVSPALEAALLADAPRVTCALADEGPGLSGSSFAAVLELLDRGGVPPERVHLFPAHLGGPGPQAAPRSVELWERARRWVAPFTSVFGQGPAAWADRVTGAVEGPVQEIGGGAWRALHFPDRQRWPAADVRQERRKLLFTAGGRRWLARFAGLGRYGEERRVRGRALAAAGFCESPVALRHGFLFERWRDDAKPLPRVRVRRDALVARVAEYVAFRAGAFRAREGDGASPLALLAMARHNASQALGASWGHAAERIRELIREVAETSRPIAIDGKMQPWEWLVLPGGEILKADALDHCAGHDLVGCQDPAWDVVGAEVELSLRPDEARLVASWVERRAGIPMSPAKLDFYAVAYLAFQLGRATLAADALGADAEESARLRSQAGRYAALLRERLVPREDAARL